MDYNQVYILLEKGNSGGLYSYYHKFFNKGNRLLKWKTLWVLLSFQRGMCAIYIGYFSKEIIQNVARR